MKRIFAIFLCLLALSGSVYAAQEQRYVALTFDDGPSGRFTRRLLDGLQERSAKATFLLCGYRMALYPRETERILEEGHEIGLHGYTHAPMNLMNRAKLDKEIADTLRLLPEDYEAIFLRPPGGQMNPTVRAAAEAAGLAILSWSVDPKDWATCDTAAVEQAVVDKVDDGDVILLHDMTDSSVDAALAIVDILTARGFQFVTVSELARLKGAVPEPGLVYKRF